eukprot:42958_1
MDPIIPITGDVFIQRYRDKVSWMKHITGWNNTDIYQIQKMLFVYNTYNTTEIEQNIENIFMNKFGAEISNKITKHILSYCKWEQLHYKIKNGHDIRDLGKSLSTMIDTVLIEEKQERHTNLKIELYEAIADCFAFSFPNIEQTNYSLDLGAEWMCSNCGNNNFSNYIGGVINYRLKACTLCGISQRDSIVRMLKEYDSYIYFNNNTTSVKHDSNASDKLDVLVQQILNDREQPFDLICPQRADNQPCVSILRLAKKLLIHNEWLKLSHNTHRSMIQMDIALSFIPENIFTNIFIECMDSQFGANVMEKDALNKETFLQMNEEEFIQFIQNHIDTEISKTDSKQLYNVVVNCLLNELQKNPLKYMSFSDMTIIDNDYHHIYKNHIEHGSKTTNENVFRFFQYLIHRCETTSQMKHCRSQLKQRFNKIKLSGAKEQDPLENQRKKNVATLKHNYQRNKLEEIHEFLVHSDWTRRFKQYFDTDEQITDEKVAEIDEEIDILDINKHKYVTELGGDDVVEYGLGIDHPHPFLTPIYGCIREELLMNKLCRISPTIFEDFLIKAIERHRIALKEYNDTLICKYYHKEYNILRNEPIGIRHILAIICYTDTNDFCYRFRQTYRRIDDETKTETTNRHRELYYYARALYETFELFGTQMSKKLTVYHGLDKMMYFQRFSAFFNQPISTTTVLIVAQQFSQGVGIILELKSASQLNDTSKVPKYLSVEWLSAHPNEKELLFYGGNVTFQICDIYEATTMKSHKKELSLFNLFQKMVQNQHVDWNSYNNNMCNSLIKLIQTQKTINMKKKNNEQMKKVKDYGQQLFDYFCNNENTTKIGINNIQKLPTALCKVLFENINNISLVPITNLFQCLQHLSINELNIDNMTISSTQYAQAVLKYINESPKTFGVTLKSIIFESTPDIHGKRKSALQQLRDVFVQKLKQKQWRIEYEFAITTTKTHIIRFINYGDEEHRLYYHIKKRQRMPSFFME